MGNEINKNQVGDHVCDCRRDPHADIDEINELAFKRCDANNDL